MRLSSRTLVCAPAPHTRPARNVTPAPTLQRLPSTTSSSSSGRRRTPCQQHRASSAARGEAAARVRAPPLASASAEAPAAGRADGHDARSDDADDGGHRHARAVSSLRGGRRGARARTKGARAALHPARARATAPAAVMIFTWRASVRSGRGVA
eukprot:scaffold2090_cov225-Prasinococcus_capsulatus_cf.AAC.30